MRRFPLPLLLPALLAAGCGSDAPAPAAAPAPRAPVRGALLVTVEGELPPFDGDDTFATAKVEAVSPGVLPSAATVLTGLIPPEPGHGLRVDGVGALPPATPTLATRFRDKGFDCAAFLSDVALSPVHGLTNGFSAYSAAIAPTNRATRFHRTSAEVCAEARDWLAKRPAGAPPAFVWLHLSPYAGAAPEERPARAREALAALRPVVDAFEADAPVLVLPLFGLGSDPDLPRGLDVEDPAFREPTAFFRGALACRPHAEDATSVLDAGCWFGLVSPEAGLPNFWCESLVPWYAFRLPPLLSTVPELLDFSRTNSLAADPVAVPLAHQNAMVVLRANGHLGEGLVPPCTNGVVRRALDEDGRARVARWRAAVSAPATNRVAALRALVQSDPDVPLFHHELGEALLREKDFTGACNELSAAARLGWNMVLANRLQARCHAMIGNVPAAIDRAEAAFLVNEGDPLPRRELSELLLRTGTALLAGDRFQEAGECLDRARLLAPDSPAPRFEQARLLLRTGDTNAAATALSVLLRDHPDHRPARQLLSTISR